MKIFLLFFSVCFFVQISLSQQTGSWGDQGNGTFKNPILEANYPDDDIMKVKDTYYMMSSTAHFTPGMVILKSKDLVNWEFSNYILQAPITFDRLFNIGQPYSMVNRGTWAGSFGFDGLNYYAYWCHNTVGSLKNSYSIMYSKAASIEGPWAMPKELKWPDGSSINTTDPGVFWDLEKKQAWICLTIKGAVKIYSLSWDGKQMKESADGGIVVTKDLEGESNKVYKFGGNYYVMNSHGGDNHGTRVRMEAFHRAKSMEGPWEGRLVLENGNGTDRHPSQGTLLKLKDGSWWYMHQLARGTAEERYMGRPQFLEPVVWKDGWPLIGVDTDNDGIGEVIWEHKKPIEGFPVTAPASDDNFTKPVLGLQWNWRFNPKMDRWSLSERPGYLRLKACVSAGTPGDPESVRLVPNLLGQRTMGRHKNVMTTKIDLKGMASGQEAGFHVSAGEYNIIGVKKDDKGKMVIFFKHEPAGKAPIVVQKGVEIAQNNVWFRATIEDGLVDFFYSLDGKKFIRFGSQERLLFAGFTSNMVGFYTMNEEEKGYIDVDWFTYQYDGPKGKTTGR